EARIDGDAVKIKNLKLKQTFPEESSKILIEGTETAVDFKWEAQKGTDLVLELSRRPDMEIVSYRKKSSKENESVSLKTGTHYWRIASSDGTQTSEIRNIRIIQKKPVHLYSPVNNRAFIYRESPPLISFSWSNNDPGTSYLLEYSNDSSFENPVQIRLRSGRISRYLAEGDYYWRVTHGEKDAVIARSPVQQFSVKKTEAYSPPRLINPVENSELDEPVFSNQGVMFNWLSSGQIKLFELEISDDPQFKNILFKESTDANYQTVIQKFHQGRYYWRVKGKDAGGIYTDYSKPKSFRVIFPRKITHLYPRQNYIMEINDYNEAGLQFGWKPIGIGGKYRILISRSEDMKQSVLDRIVGWNRVNVYLLNPGAFYWKVQMLGTNRNVLLESPVRKLTILDNLSAPEMIDPKRGETIDLTQEENLVFRLKKVPGAENYVLYLYETEGNRKIFRKILTSENYVFQDLDILNTGEFYWTITALTTRNKREIRSKTVKGHFKIKVKLLKPPEFNF
ncbi:MAG: hypothetical protein OEZ34_14280, partial [Spirochaetia bacterium]|nr:hypothetical protein [Spirochaetia bacterium]